MTSHMAQAVRDAYASTLAELAAAVRHEAFGDAYKEEKRPIKRAVLEKLSADAVGSTGGGALHACLSQPLLAAALAGKRDVCTAMAVAWVGYIGALQQRGGSGGVSESASASALSLTDVLVELAVQV